MERNAKNPVTSRAGRGGGGGGGLSLDVEDSIRVLEPPKGQQEHGYSILTPLNPCNLRSGSFMGTTFQPSFVIILHSANTQSLTPSNT